MQLTEQDYIVLEDYLDNSLEKEAREALESKIRNDSEFRLAAFQYLQTLKALRIKREDAVKNQLEELDKSEDQPIIRPMKKWWLGAVGLGVAAMMTYFVMRPQTNAYVLLAEKYDEPIDIIRTRGVGEDLKMQANQAYLDKDYKKSSELYLKAFETNQLDSSFLLYAGISFYGNKELEKSVICLTPLTQSQSQNSEAAQWYLALAYLRKENTDQSIKILDKLIILNTTFSQKALSLKEEIKQLKK